MRQKNLKTSLNRGASQTPLYWDANATSKLRPHVRELLLESTPLNPSSIHSIGRSARGRLRKARAEISNFLFPKSQYSHELVFCSGGTEACNSILSGFLPQSLNKTHIVLSAVEHPAIRDYALHLESAGAKLREVFPQTHVVGNNVVGDKTPYGLFTAQDFLPHITSTTEVVTLMLANNECGIGLDVPSIAGELRKSGYQGAIVSDITQALGKTEVDVGDLFSKGVDAVAFSSHKLGALPGLGCFVLNTESSCRQFRPMHMGGPQENRFRAGTETVYLAEGLAAVCEHLSSHLEQELEQRRNATGLFIDLLNECNEDIELISPHPQDVMPYSLSNTVYIRLPDTRADDVVVALDLEGICCSLGSACSSGKQEVSHVPLALGLNSDEARSCLRISFDWDITEAEVREGIARIRNVFSRMQNAIPERPYAA